MTERRAETAENVPERRGDGERRGGGEQKGIVTIARLAVDEVPSRLERLLPLHLLHTEESQRTRREAWRWRE